MIGVVGEEWDGAQLRAVSVVAHLMTCVSPEVRVSLKILELIYLQSLFEG